SSDLGPHRRVAGGRGAGAGGRRGAAQGRRRGRGRGGGGQEAGALRGHGRRPPLIHPGESRSRRRRVALWVRASRGVRVGESRSELGRVGVWVAASRPRLRGSWGGAPETLVAESQGATRLAPVGSSS